MSVSDELITVECPPLGFGNSGTSRTTTVYKRLPDGKGLDPVTIIERRRTLCMLNASSGLFFLRFDDGSEYVQTPRGDSYPLAGFEKWVCECKKS